MSEYKRRRGESAAAWCARLGEVDMAALSARQLEELTLRRVLAGRILRRETRGRLSKSAVAQVNGGPESEDLHRCKRFIQALSVEDRLRLMKWLEATLLD